MKSAVKLFLWSLLPAAVLLCLLPSGARAATQTVDVFPNSDISLGGWTSRSSGDSNWNRIHRLVSERADNSWMCSATRDAVSYFGAGAAKNPAASSLPMPDVQQGVTQIAASATGKSAVEIGAVTGQPRIQLEIMNNSGVLASGAQTEWTGPSTGFATVTGCNAFTWGDWRTSTAGATFSPGNELMQAQINSLQFRLIRDSADNIAGRGVRVMAMTARLHYVTYATLVQSSYRVYQNANSQTPGTPLAPVNNRAELDIDNGSIEDTFRVRMNVQTQDERWLQNYGSYLLQFAQKDINAPCSTATGWTNVTSYGGKVRWHMNSNVPTATQLTNANSAHDPTTGSGTNVYQRYYSHPNAVTKSAEVPVGNSALWDFSLKLYGANYGESFCLRLGPNASTQPLNNFQQYPEIVATGGTLGLFVIDRDFQLVPSPYVVFPSQLTQMTCVQSRATMGDFQETWIIAVNDERWNGGNWSLHMAPTAGVNAKWTSLSPLNTRTYSFNDPSGSPPGCNNGQLRVDLTSANIYPVFDDICSAAGVTLGANAGYLGAAPITLASAAGVEVDCPYALEGVGLEQSIPGGMPPDHYSLDMTLTLMSS